MKFMVDNHLPVKLAVFLRWRGHEVRHVIDLPPDQTDDRPIWDLASASGHIVISKDEDFVRLSKRPGDAGRLLWVRLGNCRNVFLIERVAASLDDICAAFESGCRLVELE